MIKFNVERACTVILLWAGTLTGFSQNMTVDDNINVGVNKDAPEFDLHLEHGNGSPLVLTNQNGLAIEHDGSNDHKWIFYISNTSGHLQLYHRTGTTTILEADFSDDGGLNTTSDIAQKKNVLDMETEVLDKVMQLRPVQFQYKHYMGDRLNYGLIAQEANKVFPDMVYHSIDDDGNDQWTLGYGKLIPILVKSIQEQQNIIGEKQLEIEQLKTQQIEILKRLAAIEAR